MGLDANTYVLPQDDGNVLAGASVAPAVADSDLRHRRSRARYMLRPDYRRAAIHRRKRSRRRCKAAKLGLFPNLNGSGSYGVASTDSQGGAYRNTGAIAVTLSIPIFDQGITHAQVEQVQGQLDQPTRALESAHEAGIQLNVKQTLVNLVVGAARRSTQTQAELANAREVLQATQAQYAAGVTTLPLLLNAQVGLTQALVDSGQRRVHAAPSGSGVSVRRGCERSGVKPQP